MSSPIANGTLVTFRYSGQDVEQLRMLSGRPARIARRLRDGDEVDEDEVGRMYALEFDEGYKAHAFEDELEVI